MNTRRVVNIFSRKPVIGITTAMVRRKAVVSHCARLAVTVLALPARSATRPAGTLTKVEPEAPPGGVTCSV